MAGKVAFIGCGAMGGALARGAVASGVYSARDVVLCDAVPDLARSLAEEIGARAETDCVSAVRSASAVVLAVKPKDIPVVTETIRPVVTPDHLVVSIAAGMSLARLEGLLGEGIPIIRVMPNTPCQVGAGMSVYSVGSAVRAEHEETVRRLFGAVGLVERADEALMDAVTALSGSGPAYFFLVVEALADGGVKVGLPRSLALKLAEQTMLGAAQLLLATGEHPAVLKDRVASPAGTTIAGLEALEQEGVRYALILAVERAAARSRELGG